MAENLPRARWCPHCFVWWRARRRRQWCLACHELLLDRQAAAAPAVAVALEEWALQPTIENARAVRDACRADTPASAG